MKKRKYENHNSVRVPAGQGGPNGRAGTAGTTLGVAIAFAGLSSITSGAVARGLALLTGGITLGLVSHQARELGGGTRPRPAVGFGQLIALALMPSAVGLVFFFAFGYSVTPLVVGFGASLLVMRRVRA